MKGPDFWKNFSGTFKFNILLSLRMEKIYIRERENPEHWTVKQIEEIFWGKFLDV